MERWHTTCCALRVVPAHASPAHASPARCVRMAIDRCPRVIDHLIVMQAPPHALPLAPPWRPLSIDALDVLTEDVDRTIESFRFVLKERPNELVAAKDELEMKMALLFSFKKQHHNDDRVVVVELLRLKLRKVLRETTDPPQRQSSNSPTSSQHSKPSTQQHSPPQARSQQPHALNGFHPAQQQYHQEVQKQQSQQYNQQQSHIANMQQQSYAPQVPFPQQFLPNQTYHLQQKYPPSQHLSHQQNNVSTQPYDSPPHARPVYHQQSPPQARQHFQQPLEHNSFSQPYPQHPTSPARPRSPVRLPMQLQHTQPQARPTHQPQPQARPTHQPQPYQNLHDPSAHYQFQQQYSPQHSHYQPPPNHQQYSQASNPVHHQPVRLPMQLQYQHQKQQQQTYQPPPIMLKSSHNDAELSLFHPPYPNSQHLVNSAPTPEPSSPPTPVPYPQPHTRATNRYESDTSSQTLSGYENGSERGSDYTTNDDVRSEFSTTSSTPSQSQMVQPTHSANGEEKLGIEKKPSDEPQAIEHPKEQLPVEAESHELKQVMIERPQSKLFTRLQSQAQEKEKQEKEKQEAQPKKKVWRKLRKPKPRIDPKAGESLKEPKNMKPLYDWEVRYGPRPPPVKDITQSLSPTSPLSRAVEFKIVLTPAEFEQLQEKRNMMARSGIVASSHTNFVQKNTGRLAYTKPDIEKSSESPFLLSSTPYVDPHLNESIRTVDKSKWVAPVNFFSTPPKRASSTVPPQSMPITIESSYAPRTTSASVLS